VNEWVRVYLVEADRSRRETPAHQATHTHTQTRDMNQLVLCRHQHHFTRLSEFCGIAPPRQTPSGKYCIYRLRMFVAVSVSNDSHYGRPAQQMQTLYFRPLVASFFFFPRLISAVADWMSTILYTWCGLSANFESRSEMCCTRLAEKYRMQTTAKKLPSGHHRTTLYGCIFATNARIDS